MKSVGVVLLCLTAICWARVANTPEDPLVLTFNSLPETEKKFFLEYSLAVGLISEDAKENKRLRLSNGQKNNDFVIPDSLNMPENLVEKFSAMDIPIKSTLLLLSWVKEEFGLQEQEVQEFLLKGKVCPPTRGSCFDYGDFGPLCCPW